MEHVITFTKSISRTTEFETLINPYLHHLYKVALRFTNGSVADSEDLIQELLIKLYAKRQQLEAIEKLRPWLVKILYRTFIDHIRRQKRSPLHLVIKPKTEEPDIIETIACSRSGPADCLINDSTNKIIMKAVQGLNEEQRTVCILHDMEGYTLIELKEILETPLGTLKSRLHRARARLRKTLHLQGFKNKKRGDY